MTVKEFFKSKTFRCIVVLLCIALVSGGLLAVMNDLLNVSDEERVLRTVKSIYGKEMPYEELVVDASSNTEKGTLDKVYKLEDGNYLMKATGFQGYKQGSVSVWCVARFDDKGAFVALTDVSIASYDKQTLMSKFTKSLLSDYQGDAEFTQNVSGATYSSKALNNALNTALAYIRASEGGAA